MKPIAGLFLMTLFFLSLFGYSEAAVVCPGLVHTLGRGATGREVSELQSFLADYPEVYPEAQITGFFGVLTEKALQRFQAKYGIASSGSPAFNGYGLLGPRTRAMINVICTESAKGAVLPEPAKTETVVPPADAAKPGFYAPVLPYFNPNLIQEPGSAPKMDLKINGSDGPVSVYTGSDVTISWTLSDHKWWYCGKLKEWSGSLTSPASGSEVVRGLNYSKVFKLSCYVDNKVFEDEVIANVVEAPAPSATPTPAAVSKPLKTGVPYEGLYGKVDCVLRVKPADVIYMSETTPYARWEVESSPTADWYYYWHESVNDGPEKNVYAGKTQLYGQTIYNPKTEYYDYKPMKIRRRAYVVIDQKHYPDAYNPVHPEGADKICITNEVEFEIKESRTSSAFSKSFASLFNAIFPYIDIAGY